MKILLAVDEDYVDKYMMVGETITAEADAQKMVEETRREVAQDIMNLYIESNDFIGDMQKKYLGE